MPDIPTRLVVISARVPEGERCDGCEWARTVRPGDWEAETCCSLYTVGNGWPNTRGIRLPVCRERDGWACYPPGSGVPELVEAAKNLDDAYHDDDLTRSRENAIDEVISRAFDVGEADRKVAKESNDVPRD